MQAIYKQDRTLGNQIIREVGLKGRNRDDWTLDKVVEALKEIYNISGTLKLDINKTTKEKRPPRAS